MRRYIGFALEDTFGAGAFAKYFSDVRSANVETPSERYTIFGGVGRSMTAAIAAPFIPSGSIELPADTKKMGVLYRILAGFYGCFGTDPATEVSTELSAGVSNGSTTLSVDDESNFAVGDVVQLGDDFVNSELHKVTGTTTGEITIEEGLLRPHAVNSLVKKVDAPYTHFYRATQERNLPSAQVDVVKDFNSQSFKGVVANGMQATLGREFLDLSFDLLAATDAQFVPPDPPASTLLGVDPYNFADVSSFTFEPEAGGATLDLTPNTRESTFSVSNGITEDDGIRYGSVTPKEFVLGGIEATFQAVLAFRQRNDLHSLLTATQPGKVSLVLERGTNQSLEFQLPRAYMNTIQTPLSDQAMLLSTLTFSAVPVGGSDTPFAIVYKNSETHLYT